MKKDITFLWNRIDKINRLHKLFTTSETFSQISFGFVTKNSHLYICVCFFYLFHLFYEFSLHWLKCNNNRWFSIGAGAYNKIFPGNDVYGFPLNILHFDYEYILVVFNLNDEYNTFYMTRLQRFLFICTLIILKSWKSNVTVLFFFIFIHLFGDFWLLYETYIQHKMVFHSICNGMYEQNLTIGKIHMSGWERTRQTATSHITVTFPVSKCATR